MMRIELNDRKKGIDDKFDKHENEMKAMQFGLTHTVSEAHATSKKLAEDEQMIQGMAQNQELKMEDITSKNKFLCEHMDQFEV